MVRLILYLVLVAAVAAGLSWLADRPGEVVVTWEGLRAETSVFRAVVLLAAFVAVILVALSLLRQLFRGPSLVGQYYFVRRQKRGLDALSSGMIAIGAGDRVMAGRYAQLARKSLPNEPLTHLLRAQAAQLSGDRLTARRIYEAMLSTPDTEQLGLRGLFVEAEREGEIEAARQFAERALRLNAKLAWAAEALFDVQCRQADWAGALETLSVARRAQNVSRADGDRRRAVLLTAQAQALEEKDPDRALSLSLEAHGLAPGLVPAAVIAGRILASRGNTPRAARVVERTWMRAPHPDLARVHAFARVGDSPRDRLERVRRLAALTPAAAEGPIATAAAAIEARLFDDARAALIPLLDGRMTRRVALLMARVEGEQHGDKGRVREWLARAVNAPRDPAWTADGVVAEEWAPVSPVTGALDAFQWRVPVESADPGGSEGMAQKLEEFVTLGAAPADRPPQSAAASVPADLAHAPNAPADSKALVPTEPGEIHGGTLGTVPAPSPARREITAGSGETDDAASQNGAARLVVISSVRAKDAANGEIRDGPRGQAMPETASARPHIYVPPHAPDDPGPESGDFETDRYPPDIARSS